MNSKLIKIISSVLIVTFLLSCFTVFAFAETGAATVDTKLWYNRTYDEGWDFKNGFYGDQKGHEYFIDYEVTKDFDYNYFMRIEVENGNDGFVEARFSPRPSQNGTVLQFDVKTDDYTSLGDLAYLRTELTGSDSSTGQASILLNITENELRLPSIGVATASNNKITSLSDGRWVTVAIALDFGNEEQDGTDYSGNYGLCPTCYEKNLLTATKCTGCQETISNTTMWGYIEARVYVGYADSFDPDAATDITSSTSNDSLISDANLEKTVYYTTKFRVQPGKRRALDILRIGPAKHSNVDEVKGMSLCLDNVSFYNGEKYNVLTQSEIEALDQGHGSMVQEAYSITENILTGSGGDKSNVQYINEALLLKVGVNYGLFANKREPILEAATSDGTVAYGAPVKIDGTVFVPLDAMLEYIGYPVYAHEDGLTFDFTTENASAIITIGRDVATVTGEDGVLERVPLKAAPKGVRDEATGREYVVIAMEDIPTLFDGYYVTYDEMGLIAIAEKGELFTRDSEGDITLMVDLMCKFIYEYKSGDEYYNMVKENTNNFEHPYILVESQDTFDNLHAVWKGEIDDPTLKSMIDAVVSTAIPSDGSMKSSSARVGNTYIPFKYGWHAWIKAGLDTSTTLEDIQAITPSSDGYRVLSGVMTETNDGTGAIINGAAINPHASQQVKNSSQYNGGYDYDGGRLNESGYYAELIRLYALCYQITRQPIYGYMAYDVALAMSKWEHWGQGHFLNCADATAPYATAYDWMYNDWVEWGLDVTKIEEAIYSKGVYHGTLVSGIEGTPRCIRERRQGTAAFYTTMTNNWNAVCTSGMTVGALALLGVEDVAKAENRPIGPNYSKWVSDSKWLLTNNMATLTKNGLGMYAPDGSYIESPNYWVYSTRTLFYMIWSLNTAAGDDFGLLDTWAMDKTFFYACQIEFPSSIKTDTDNPMSVGYQFWNYHDSNQDYIDSSMFFYAADALGINSLAALRMQQLESKPVSMFDILAYKPEYAEIDMEQAYNELDRVWVLDSCEGIVARDHFGDGATYVGVMGNANNASHGQVDSGNFIYAKDNYVWFCDLGAENYNVYGYFSNDEWRYRYYRMTAEGANVISVIDEVNNSVPNGQLLNQGGKLESYEVTEYGMKAIIDNKDVYPNCIQANRGVLFTNNYKTVVIQDELKFTASQTLVWVAHTGARIKISDDGRVAWLIKTINGEETVLRCTLVSAEKLTFTTMSATEYILSATRKPNESTDNGGVAEKDRSKYQRLCIKSANNIIQFDCAVVIEEVDNEYMTPDDVPVEYEWESMSEWVIKESFTSSATDENFMGNVKFNDIYYAGQAHDLIESGRAFDGATENFFFWMSKASACIDLFKEDDFKLAGRNDPEVWESYQNYFVDVVKYENFRTVVNSAINKQLLVGQRVGGYIASRSAS